MPKESENCTQRHLFRSPKMAPKQEAQNGSAAASPRGAARDLREAVLMGGSADPREADRTKRLLRKTNSWHPATPTVIIIRLIQSI